MPADRWLMLHISLKNNRVRNVASENQGASRRDPLAMRSSETSFELKALSLAGYNAAHLSCCLKRRRHSCPMSERLRRRRHPIDQELGAFQPDPDGPGRHRHRWRESMAVRSPLQPDPTWRNALPPEPKWRRRVWSGRDQNRWGWPGVALHSFFRPNPKWRGVRTGRRHRDRSCR